MTVLHRIISLVFFVSLLELSACAGTQDIFPTIVLDTNEADVILPNPISIVTDPANGQILVANSNVDIFFNSASLAVLAVDATTPSAPQLSATQIIEAPNFAGEMFDDGAGGIYIPFRESADASNNEDDAPDIIQKYTLSAGAVTLNSEGSVAANPYGIAGDGTNLYVVSDDTLEILDTSFNVIADVDLTAADDADFTDALSADVQDVVVDTTGNRAIVSNSGGKMFVVDLATTALVETIVGPESSRDMILDGQILYVLDGSARLVWVFNLANLAAPTDPIEDRDDSEFLLGTISVGNNPSGMVLDTVNSRLYVSNFNDETVSVIDTLSLLEIARVSLDNEDFLITLTSAREGSGPQGLALGTYNGTQYLFVAVFASNAVIMIDTNTLKVVEVYPDNDLQLEEDTDDL